MQRNWSVQENDLTYRSPPYRSTHATNSLWAKKSITCEKIVRPRFMSRLLVVSRIMAHPEIQIVPVLVASISAHFQSVISFARKFPWTVVIADIAKSLTLKNGKYRWVVTLWQ
jgi:hypothetical protein